MKIEKDHENNERIRIYDFGKWQLIYTTLLVIVLIAAIVIISSNHLIGSEATVGLVGGLIGYLFGKSTQNK